MAWEQKIQHVVTASRPLSWTFGPIVFGIGIVHSRQIPKSQRALALAALQIFSLSLPLSIILFGINDVYDFETDSCNPRKIASGLQGSVLPPENHGLVRTAAFISTIFILAVSLLVMRRNNIVAVLSILFFAWQYSSPPLRLKEVPVLDSLSNGIIVYLVWFCGFSFSGFGLLKVTSRGLVLGLCTSAIHALGAVMDFDADTASGQRTIATALGQQHTVILSALCYLLAASREKPISLFGIYLWAGTFIMLAPCLDINLAERAFRALVCLSIVCAITWICVRSSRMK